MSAYNDYDKACCSYDSLRFAVGSDVIAGMMQLYCGKPLGDLHLLDAGCGTGNYTKALMDAGLGHVSMLDASSGMLGKAREKLAAEISVGRVVDVTQAKLPRLPYPNCTFDGVLFSLVLHHLQTDPDGVHFPAIEETIAEAKRVSKTDGVIAIATLFPETFLSRAWYTKLNESITKKFTRVFPTLEDWKTILGKNGLKLMSKLDHYRPTSLEIAKAVNDPLGPTKKTWRDMYSYWACASREEITDVENKVVDMHRNGTLDAFVRNNNNIDYFFHLSFIFAAPV